MKRLLIASVVLLASPVLAHQHNEDDPEDTPAVLDRQDVIEQLEKLESLITDSMDRARKVRPAWEALRRARAQLTVVRDQVSSAPGPREWYKAQRDPNRYFGEMGREH